MPVSSRQAVALSVADTPSATQTCEEETAAALPLV